MSEGGALELIGGVLPPLLAIVGLLLLLRWWSRRGGARGGQTTMRITGRTGLSRNASLAVVEVDRRRLLLGVTDHGVTLLSELSPPATDATGVVEGGVPTLDHDPGDRDLLAGLEAPPAALHQDRPRMGLIDRLREMTVRTHLRGPIHAARR